MARSRTYEPRSRTSRPGHGRANPRLPEYHHARGRLLETLQRTDDAEAAYREALRLDPDFAASASDLALLLGRSERAAEGIEVASTLLERLPSAEDVLRQRALLRYQLRDAEGFVEDLTRAFEIVPSAPLSRMLGSFYQTARDEAAARHWLEQARALDPLGQSVWRKR